MKKTAHFSCVLGIVMTTICLSSCQKCPKFYGYTPIDPRIDADTFKMGSYFIYEDTVDQIIDSEYVFEYLFLKHELVFTIDGCSSYTDDLEIYEKSFRNGVSYNDTVFWGLSEGYILGIDDYKWANIEPQGQPSLNLESDMTISNYTVAGTTYPVVYKSSTQALIVQGIDTIHEDIYFATGFGIVQRIEHRPTGDVPWNLIRHHIVH